MGRENDIISDRDVIEKGVGKWMAETWPCLQMWCPVRCRTRLKECTKIGISKSTGLDLLKLTKPGLSDEGETRRTVKRVHCTPRVRRYWGRATYDPEIDEILRYGNLSSK